MIEIKHKETGAVLWREDAGEPLVDADLRDADLASLTRSDLYNLGDYVLAGIHLEGALLPEGVPVVPCLDARILAELEKPRHALNMDVWHGDGARCNTTHCRAGWAIHLAGEAGYSLEWHYGPELAGALIYAASDPTEPIPNFHCSRAEAVRDLRRRAGRDQKTQAEREEQP